MLHFLRFLLLLALWTLSRILFRIQVQWLTPYSAKAWSKVSVIAFLHHTSLLEFLFVGAVPLSQVWRMAGHVVVPVADKTMERPLVGWFLRRLAPKVISITRKKDESWDRFLSNMEASDIIIIFPEGRMMRKTGLDKDNNPMSIRGGIADILQRVDHGELLLAYSGGLHHVQIPGEPWIHPFKKIKMTFELVPIMAFKAENLGRSSASFKINVIKNLETRMHRYCPKTLTEAESQH